MSGFIPPLISSSPPPVPDFDDDEEDDDVEFGIGIGPGIGEDLDFSAPGNEVHEKKDKILEIENRRLEVSGTTNNWKCEEQDSTSQDSGLCMASQSSEGMSPLPQSDDEEKFNQDNNDNIAINMKHSSTVMFNPEETTSSKNNCTIAYNNDITLEDDSEEVNIILPTDTGQNKHNASDVVTNKEVLNGDNDYKNNLNNESDSDSKFVWGNFTNDSEELFQNVSQQSVGDNDSANLISNIPVEAEHVETSDSLFTNGIDSLNENSFSNVNETSVVNDVENEISSSVSVNNSITFGDDLLNNPDSNLCDHSISMNQKGIEKNCGEVSVDDFVNKDDDDDEDDFGNFASVTIPNCESVFNNSCVTDSIFSIPNSDQALKTDVLSYQNDELSPKNNGSDIEIKSTAVSLGSSTCSGVNKSENSKANDDSSEINSRQNNLNLKQFSGTSSDFDCGNEIVNNDSEDDFDDFSDFTQSSVLPVTTVQPQEVISKSDQNQPTNQLVSSKSNLEEIFPKSDNEIYSVVPTSNLEAGPVWKHLCPLESSPALTFQWSNSIAHNKLLTALSIDSRNILFGPHWNANIPRFAANLGTNPLQPVQATKTHSGFSASPVHTTSEDSAVVPDAHFDWVGSGLTNPLDSGSHSALLDLEILSTFDNLSTTGNSAVTVKVNDDFEQLNKSCKTLSTVDNLNCLSDEAESIISLLPDLNFMRKTYIDILISKA